MNCVELKEKKETIMRSTLQHNRLSSRLSITEHMLMIEYRLHPLIEALSNVT